MEVHYLLQEVCVVDFRFSILFSRKKNQKAKTCGQNPAHCSAVRLWTLQRQIPCATSTVQHSAFGGVMCRSVWRRILRADSTVQHSGIRRLEHHSQMRAFTSRETVHTVLWESLKDPYTHRWLYWYTAAWDEHHCCTAFFWRSTVTFTSSVSIYKIHLNSPAVL